MYSRFQLAKKYIQYWLQASNGKGHGIHSPFVYDFTRKVLNDKNEYPCYKTIEPVRKELLHDRAIIEVDDFGAGASSFGYLKSMPVDYLKIDGQFVRDLVTDPLDEAAVRCFIDVAKVVNMRTVAEFVDNAEVLQRLREMGTDYAQGFFLHRPAPIHELLNPVSERSE